MLGHGEKLTRTQELAIAALLQCRTIKSAAKRCGVDHDTLAAWIQLPDFAREYRAARRRILDHAIGNVSRAATDAVATLRTNLKDIDAKVRNAAAKTLLDIAFRTAGVIDDLIDEVEELKKTIKKEPPR